ncbi:MAG TPA: hypothetical protein VHN14_22550, partial [Kofleriaceae bacterium]|nr:hypothetical protein [Kofleriaceae bacterium]
IMRTTYLACAALAIAACWSDDRPIQWQRPRSVLGPIPLKAHVAYVDSALDRVVLIDVAADAPVISHTAIGRRALYAVPSANRHQLFVITRGEQAIHEGEIDQPPRLWVVDAQHPEATALAYAIGSPFDRIAVSPDGKLAVAYFSAGGTDPDGFFRNPNELAIIDLTSPPSDTNPALDTIRSFGSVPDGIALSPPMVLPHASDPTPRSFAFILSANTLTVLDATHPDRHEISIRLDLGGAPVIPREVVFAPNTASAYVRSDHARDVLQVLLEGEPPDPTELHGNDFRAVVAELGAGGGPTDIAVYDDASGRRKLLASTPSTGEVVVIDADTAQFRSIPIADPIDRILVFPGSDAAPHQALFAAIGAALPRLYVLQLDHLDDPLAQVKLDKITLDKPVRDVVAVPGRDVAMIVHDDARTVLGLLDLSTRATAPLLGVGKLDAYDFSPDGSHLFGVTTGVARVGFVALDNLHPTDFRLDDPPSHILSTANGKIFVDHSGPFGHATIIPSPSAGRSDAVVLSGFLTQDLLDEEP